MNRDFQHNLVPYEHSEPENEEYDNSSLDDSQSSQFKMKLNYSNQLSSSSISVSSDYNKGYVQPRNFQDTPSNFLSADVLIEDVDESHFTKQKQKFVPQTSWLRWPQLFFFVNCIMIVSSQSVSLAPASTYIALAYQVPILEVNMCNIVFTATFVPATFASIWMYKEMKSDTVLRIACVIMILGGWIRMWVDVEKHSFWPVLFGQILISLAQPVVYNVMTQFGNQWFPDNERSLVTSLCGLLIPGGNLIGFALAGIIFSGVEKESSQGVENQLLTMMWTENIWITVICVPYFIILKDKPQFPPSLVSLEKAKEAPFCENIKKALRLPEYVKLIFGFALMQGSFLAFGTNIAQIFGPVGFTDVEISILGSSVILTGVIASMGAGILVHKFHKYLLMIRISAFGSFMLVGLAVVTFQTKSVLLITINMLVAAIFLVPVIPVGIDFAGELTFPQEETVCTDFLLMTAQGFGFCLSLIVLQCALINASLGLGVIVICAGIASIITLTIKEDLKRLKFTNQMIAQGMLSKESIVASLRISSRLGPMML